MSAGDYDKLERRLLLLAHAVAEFGYSDNAGMLEDLGKAQEGYDESGTSHVVRRILSTGECRIPEADLLRYDANVRRHLRRINRRRPDPIVFRYFQTLSLLFTEWFLDRYFTARGDLLLALNRRVSERNQARFNEPEYPAFAKGDLAKLAFWMATGSGKTLLLHVNVLQFLEYNARHGRPLDNILLITPGSDLSAQHLEHFAESDIPAERFSPQRGGLSYGGTRDIVRVIEVTKLVGEKKGGGVSVPVDAFAGNNLILVDEGHKGTHGEVYRGYRDALAETGFTFEYSATFGQALDAVKKPGLTDEYSKAILFDYSYKYFYGDGFGKDFHVANVERDDDEDIVHLLLLANLLAFHEQTRTFATGGDDLKPYHLSRPLWLFVGHTVTGKAGTSDLVRVVDFLDRFTSNRDGWAVDGLEKLVRGTSDLPDSDGKPFYHDQLGALIGRWKSKRAFQPLHGEILHHVFHAGAGGHIELCALRGQDGEIGLRVQGSNKYFGLVYIDKTKEFRELVARKLAEVAVVEDAMARSLFGEVRGDRSIITVLLGARKFIEGWDSRRVSSIGLMNIGRAEGGQIIQLFGRGVRLYGRERSLKRSAFLPGAHPASLPVLERLLIFGVRANYMAQFREYLEREGVDPSGYWEFELPLWQDKRLLKANLTIPDAPLESHFQSDESVVLEADSRQRGISLDLSMRLSTLRIEGSLRNETATTKSRTGRLNGACAFLDDDRLYLALVDYAELKGYRNLVVRRSALRDILERKDAISYELTAPEGVFAPQSDEDIERLHEAATLVLQKYCNRLYRSRQKGYESRNLKAARVAEDHPNLSEPYTVKVPRSEAQLAGFIRDLCAKCPKQLWTENERLENIHFDRHLYQPLLVKQSEEKIRITPAPLEASEQAFVDKLRAHWKALPAAERQKREVFLLRNLSRGKGVGFHEHEGFYPDFILWIKQGRDQRIVFVDPHGMKHEAATSFRTRFWKEIKDYTKTIKGSAKSGKREFDAWVVSNTPYGTLKEEYSDDGKSQWDRARFHAHHIVFEDDEYVPWILSEASAAR